MALISAATVVILKQSETRPKILLVHRNPELPVLGGVWAFPGGRLSDRDKNNRSALEAARQCAVRETKEETCLDLSRDTLLPMARWITPEGVFPRFDALFFITPAPPQPVGPVVVDGREIINYTWLAAKDALKAHHRKTLRLSPPTFVILSNLAVVADIRTLLHDIEKKEPAYYEPRLIPLADGRCSVYQEDEAYHDGDLIRAGPRHRLYMNGSRLQYLRNF